MLALLHFPLILALGQPGEVPHFRVVTILGPIADAQVSGLEKFRLEVKTDRPQSLAERPPQLVPRLPPARLQLQYSYLPTG